MLSLTVNDTLMLRTYLVDDAAEHFLLVQENRKHLRPWLRWVDGHTKEDHSLEYIRYTHQQQDYQQGIILGIFEEGKLIGEVGMHYWEQELKKAQIGYWIAATHQGKNIIQQSLQRFFHHIFDTLHLNKLEIRFVVANTRSGKVAELLGCKVEGVLRASYFINGKLEDLVVTGILKQEFTKLKAVE